MRAVFALVLVVGMALAGMAVYMAQSYLGQTQDALARANEMRARTGNLVQVYAVNKSMKYGAPLTKDDVTAVFVQEAYLPAGAYRVPVNGQAPAAPAAAAAPGAEAVATPKGPLFSEKDEKPRFIMRSMEPNEIVLASRVTEPGEMAGLVGKLDKGMRAFQIKVDVASGVAGFVQPDDHIDIYWTGVSSGSVSGEVTRLIESAIRIIAVDQASGEGQATLGTVARTVTVAATQEQVARLAQAQATGRLAMSLVADATEQSAGLIEVDGNSLLGIVQQEVVQVEAKQECSIKTRKGEEVIEVPIPCTN
ncbi:MAG: Flp pilus assembly protein CpaB [Paracoccaceae bacterium]